MLYYPVIVVVFLPWALLFYGAFRKMRLCPAQQQRLQWEGVLLTLFGMAGCWLLFDQHWGLDTDASSRFAYWYARGENGFFGIGQLLLFMGYFLERRPRPGVRRWPVLAKTTAALAILAGSVVALAKSGQWAFLGLHFPWDASRILWSVGLIPFAVVYLVEARSHSTQSLKMETLNIIGDKQS